MEMNRETDAPKQMTERMNFDFYANPFLGRNRKAQKVELNSLNQNEENW